MKTWLQGAYDMHFHTAPDIVQRKCDDLELASRLKAAGMKGAVIKAHFGDTSARAALLQKQNPGMIFRGGVTLNTNAWLNPRTVEISAKMGGLFVWFPTLEALGYQTYHGNVKTPEDKEKLVAVTNDDGSLKDEALAVIEMAAKYNMIVGTGHNLAAEGMEIVRACARIGSRCVVTHADLPSNWYTVEQLKEAVSLGAVVEQCYLINHNPKYKVTAAMTAERIKAVGVEHFYLGTDFGQPGNPYSDEGMELFGEALLAAGITEEELRWMTREHPEKLFGL